MLNATLDQGNVHNVLYCGLLVTQWNAISQRYFSSWNPWSWKKRITPLENSRNRKRAPIFMRHWIKNAHFIVWKLCLSLRRLEISWKWLESLVTHRQSSHSVKSLTRVGHWLESRYHLPLVFAFWPASNISCSIHCKSTTPQYPWINGELP